MAAHAYHRRVEEPLHSPLHTQTLLPALGRFLFCPSLLMARRVYCRALDPLVDGRTRTLDELHDEPGPIVVSGPILFWKFFVPREADRIGDSDLGFGFTALESCAPTAANAAG